MEDGRIVISSGNNLTAESVATRTFSTGFRGYDQDEVRAFLKRVAEELSVVAARETEIRESMQEALHRAAHPQLDEEALTAALGEHAARLLTNAREAATNIVSEAETRAARIIGEAETKIARVRAEADGLLARRSEEAERLTAGLRNAVEADVRAQRERARAEAESEVESARTQGREMVAEARGLRERMLADLTRRRRVAEVQIEQLRAARQRLLEAYAVVRRTLDEATAELTAAEAEVQPALAAAAYGRLPAPPEVDAGDEAARRGRGAAVVSNGGAGRAGPRHKESERRSGDSEAGAASTVAGLTGGASADPPPPPPPPAAAAPSRSAEGPPPAHAPAAAEQTPDAGPPSTPPTRPLVAVPPASPPSGRSQRGLSRSSPAEERPSASANGTLTAVPSPERSAAESSSVAQVEELFARMRAAQSGAAPPAAPDTVPASAPASAPEAAPGGPVLVPSEPAVPAGLFGGAAAKEAMTAPASEPPAAEAKPSAEPDAVADESTLSRRDEQLEPLAADLVRQLKRVLQDEHNQVLDRLRQQRGRATSTVLPDAGSLKERFAAAARPLLAEAARLGAASVPTDGDDRAVPDREVDQWAAELATEIVDPLNDRLRRSLLDESTAEREAASAAEGLSAAFRQVKSQQLDPVARHHAVRAWCRGAFLATPEGAHLRWLFADEGPCPDCDDNVLAGAQPKGQPFPTGQVHPPAHVGCRCALSVSAS